MTQSSHNLLEKVLPLVWHGDCILDVGCGEGKQAKAFAQRGARVFAIDIQPQDIAYRHVEFRHQSLESFLETNTDPFNLIYLQNVLQFCPKEFVLRHALGKLIRRLKPGGAIAIETFFRKPQPAFPLASLFRLCELKPAFKGFSIRTACEFDRDRPDMAGDIRHFFITQLIIKRWSGK